MTNLQGSWIWYELMTPDSAGAKRFYEAVVGWSFVAPAPHTNGYGFLSNSDGGMTGGYLQLSDDMVAEGARPCWLGYLGVDDVDSSVSSIISAGGSVILSPRDVPMAGRIAMVADCCGAPFYIMTPTAPPDGGVSNAFSAGRNPGRCGWNELMAGNAANATEFYISQFNWDLPDAMDMGPMGSYQFVSHDGVTIGAIMQKPEQVPAAMWHHYFWVQSIAATRTAIEAGGGIIINGPMQVPGDDWIVQAIDPQGAMVSFVGGE
ncbi:VOC family protein [Novosphingobium sp.]|uniref:VOC family protein n=1 Tax=Novosphingobium sp. TaxID=1874826 RepID=UPI0025CC7422|nr:VOC family protein [Novosphingobium sp.]